MLSDEKTREKLLLGYKIVRLYLDSGCSVSLISKATGVSLATVKRSLSIISNKKDQFLRLLPELGTEEELDEIQKGVDARITSNKIVNKWRKEEPSLRDFSDEVKEIQELHKKSSVAVTDEDKKKMINLRVNGASIRTIASATGHSLDSVHGIVKGIGEDSKSSPRKK